MSSSYAREYFEKSLTLAPNETKSIPVGVVSPGTIFVLIDAFIAPNFSSTNLLSANTNGKDAVTTNNGPTTLAARPLPPGIRRPLQIGDDLVNDLPPIVDTRRGNRDKVEFKLRRSSTFALEGNGNERFDYAFDQFDLTIPQPWTLEVTNTANEPYAIQIRMFYAGGRLIRRQAVDQEALQAEIDHLVDQIQPIQLVLENEDVKKRIWLGNRWQEVMVPHTFAKIKTALSDNLLQSLLGLAGLNFSTKKDLGFKLVNKPFVSSPIRPKVTSLDGNLALKVNLGFRPNEPVEFSYEKDTVFGINLFEFNANVHRLDFSIFVDMQRAGAVNSITRVNEFYAHPFKIEVFYFDVNLPHFLIDLIGQFPKQLIENYREQIFDYLFGKLLPDVPDDTSYEGFDQDLWIKYALPQDSFQNETLAPITTTNAN